MEVFTKKHLILALGIMVLGACAMRMPSDDGLRHVGLAFGDLASWGEVYPFSVFHTYGDFNPWYGYDHLLALAAGLLAMLPLEDVTQRYIMIKGVSLILGGSFLFLVISASGITREIRDRNTFFLAVILIAALLMLPFLRILIARPFAFGTLYLVWACRSKGVASGLLSSAILTFFYPYLAWFYTVPAASAHVLSGSKRFALGAMVFTIGFLCFVPDSFWGFQVQLFFSEASRSAVGFNIGEFTPTTQYVWFYLLLLFILMAGPAFLDKKPESALALWLMLMYLIPALKYVRYFIDLTIVLVFVAYGRVLLARGASGFKGIISWWGGKLRIPDKPGASNVSVRAILVAAYACVAALMIFHNIQLMDSLQRYKDGLDTIPKGSHILADFNLQYRTLFVRPDIRLTPSCEVGFPVSTIKDEYRDFLNNGEIRPLALKTGAEFFIENNKMYINPQQGKYLERVFHSQELTVWKFKVA